MKKIPAILFLVFNRPEVTKRVFEEIRQARPARLYVAADGPRDDVEGESEKVSIVREIISNVDWDCEVKTLFRDTNLGCKNAVSSAINWFFEYEEEGVILEDDCLPDNSFFYYCQELLERYRHDSRVMMISGNNFQDGNDKKKYSYYFSRYTHIWGWATWKRAWKLWDGELSAWPEIKDQGLLKDIGVGSVAFEAYWSRVFDKYYTGNIDTWDYPWLFSSWIQHGLVILPSVNLVSNIGFGEDATHTRKANACLEVPAQKIGIPLNHPPFIMRNLWADDYTDRNIYQIDDWYNSIKNKEKSVRHRLLNKLLGN